MTGCVIGLTPLCVLLGVMDGPVSDLQWTETASFSLLQVMNSPEVGFIRSHLFLVPAVLQEWFLASRKLVRNLENWVKRYQQLDASELGICLPNQLDDLQRWAGLPLQRTCPSSLPPAEPRGLLLAYHVGSKQTKLAQLQQAALVVPPPLLKLGPVQGGTVTSDAPYMPCSSPQLPPCTIFHGQLPHTHTHTLPALPCTRIAGTTMVPTPYWS